MATQTFSGDNGEVEIGVDGRAVTITIRPRTPPPAGRTFRPRNRSNVLDLNAEPTGRGMLFDFGEEVQLGIFCRDDCLVEIKMMRRQMPEGTWVVEYAFTLTGLSGERKRALLKIFEDSHLPVDLGSIIVPLLPAAGKKVKVKASLSAPGEVSLELGGAESDGAAEEALRRDFGRIFQRTKKD